MQANERRLFWFLQLLLICGLSAVALYGRHIEQKVESVHESHVYNVLTQSRHSTRELFSPSSRSFESQSMDYPGCSVSCRFVVVPTIGPEGPPGQPGAKGDKGDTGLQGPVGSSYNTYAVLTDTVSRSISAANAINAIQFNTNVLLNNMAHSTSVLNSRLTAHTSGLYLVAYAVNINTGGTKANLDVWARINGEDVVYSLSRIKVVKDEATTTVTAQSMLPLASGQYVELMWSSDLRQAKTEYIAATGSRPSMPSAMLTLVLMQTF